MGETKTISTLFYIGATGYIGGAVLADLVKVHPDLKITALVRNPSHFQAIRDLGVEIVRGSFGDVEIISSHARSADVTLNFGDSDDVTLNEAILAGQKARVEEDGKPRAILLHTSGVAELSDGGKEGKHDANGKLWNDGVEADIRSITPQMLHGQVDVPIFHASDQGYTESYTVCPAAVVGPSTGPIPASSAFFKYLTQFVLASKKPLYVGEGANLFHAVHLEDLVDLYRLVFARILSRTDAKASPYARYYIGSSTPWSWKHIMTVFGAVLVRLGKLEDGTAHGVDVSTLPPPTSQFLGASQRLHGRRARDLGWKPRPVALEDWADAGIAEVLARQ